MVSDKIGNVKEKLRDNVTFYQSIVAPDFVFMSFETVTDYLLLISRSL